jgi:hypothetical protein
MNNVGRFEYTKGVIRIRKPKKDRQHNVEGGQYVVEVLTEIHLLLIQKTPLNYFRLHSTWTPSLAILGVNNK